MIGDRLQEINLLNLLKTGAFQFVDESHPWFPYTSGQVGPYYVQSTTVEKDGEAYAVAIRSLVKLIRSVFPAFDAISGGETRDWDFSNPVAVALKKPHLKIYKDGKNLGADIRGRSFLHVADLNNEGSSIRDYWKPIIEKNGGTLAGVVFFVDRLEEGVTVMRDLKLTAVSVVPLNERAWGIVRKANHVSASVHETLVARSRDRQAWALKTLLARPAHFKALYDEPKTRDKALKIIKTYPRISAELERIVRS